MVLMYYVNNAYFDFWVERFFNMKSAMWTAAFDKKNNKKTSDVRAAFHKEV